MATNVKGSTIASTYDRIVLVQDGNDIGSGTDTMNIEIQTQAGAATATPLYISTDRIGIGTAEPGTRLDVAADSATGTILSVINYSATSATASASLAFKTADGTEDDPDPSASGDHLGALSFAGWDTNSFSIGCSILGKCTGSVSDGVMPSEFQFHTNPSSGAVNRMTIASNGLITPGADAAQDFGSSALAWNDVYYEGGLTDTSDLRFKKDIVDSDLGLGFINALRPVKFKKLDDKDSDSTRYGLIAQEVIVVLEDLNKENDFRGIRTKNPDRYGADYIQFIAPMMKAIQELSAKVTALENA